MSSPEQQTRSNDDAVPALPSPTQLVIAPGDVAAIKNALIRYRVMAYIVGTLLVLLVGVAMPMKYAAGDDRWVAWFGIPHGWLYMILLITVWDLGRRVKWSIRNFILIALAGTIPFLSFVAEYFARKDVQRKVAAAEAALDH